MGDPEGNVGEGSGNGHHSPQGPQMGNLQSGGGGLFTRDFEKWTKEGSERQSICLCRSSMRGTWRRGAPLLGGLKDM